MLVNNAGAIVNVSSIGGEIALPLGALIIQPGIIKTAFEDQAAQQLRDFSGAAAPEAVIVPVSPLVRLVDLAVALPVMAGRRWRRVSRTCGTTSSSPSRDSPRAEPGLAVLQS